MPSAEKSHQLPFPVDFVREQLSSADYLLAQMPEFVQLDFHDLQKGQLILGSEVEVSVDLEALRKEWSTFNPAIAKFLELAGINRPTILTVLESSPNKTHYGASRQFIGRIDLSYTLEAAHMDPTTTTVWTKLDTPRAYQASSILQHGVDHLMPFLVPDQPATHLSATNQVQ